MEEKKPKPFGYIYDIVCCLNDQEYIGQTIQTVEERFKGHCNNSHQDTYIDRAINCYGRENFFYFVLKECDSQEELDKWERWFIFAKGTKAPFGYNLKDGGGNGHHSPETCAKISKALTGKTLSEETKQKLREINLGKKLSEETKQKLREINLGKKLSEVTKQKLREINLGKKLSEATKQKLREALSGENNPNYGKPSPFRKSPYQILLAEFAAIEIFTNSAIATLMSLSEPSIYLKMSGKVPFTDEQQAFLADYLGKPVEYLFARTDGKSSKPSSRRKSPFQKLLEKIAEKGYKIYAAFAVPMEMNPKTLAAKIGGKSPFTDEEKARLVEVLEAPIEYLLARDDEKNLLSNKTKPMSPEQRAKISEALSGENNPNYGKPRSDETKKKIGDAQRGEKNHAFGKPSPRRNSPFPKLLEKMSEKGYKTYAAFAVPMHMKSATLAAKIRGELPFTAEDKANLVTLLDAPIEYLLERDDEKPVKSSSHHKTPYINFLAKMREKGYNTYSEFAVPMQMNSRDLARKIRGERNFTPEQKARLVEVLDAPIEYLLARNDG